MQLLRAMLLWSLLAGPAWAASAQQREVDFQIAAQPLSGALFQFASQSGLQVLAADTQLLQQPVRAVRGRYTSTGALQRLLSGSGLTFQQVDASTIAVVRAESVRRAPAVQAGEVAASDRVEELLPAQETAELIEVQEVQVTGTRIRAPATYTAPNPVVTVTGEELRQLGYVNVADALTTLVPQNIPSYQPLLTGDDQQGTLGRVAYFIGNTIANLRGMDPAFGSRTLTLIDGRRVVSTSNQADVVDLNIVPSNLLRRVDVVTGGASSTYGSGAMAGVVNLVLNRRLTGLSIDLDHGINEAGDGSSPHVGIAGGLSLFGGRGHALLGAEWQRQAAIRNCAEARHWCAMSRTLYRNFSGSGTNPAEVLVPLVGFEEYPARFQMVDHRYSQFSPTGVILSTNAANTSGWRFTADGTGVEEYAFGYRGGTARSTMNGDGPLTTSGLTMRPSTERLTAFANLEYSLTPRTMAYVQASYARTESLNRNPYTISHACARFHTPGVAAQPGGSARAGSFIAYGGNGELLTDAFTGEPVAEISRDPLWGNANFRLVLGNAPTGRTPPYFVPPGQSGSTDTTPPTWTFTNGSNPVWQRVRSARGTDYWNLVGVTLDVDFEDPGTPAQLPGLGRNAYAFLNELTPEALYQVQSAFGNSSSSGGGPGVDNLFGTTPCRGYTALRKVWNPQIQQWTSQQSDTLRAVAGLRGTLGGEWHWEGYYQYGRTGSTSRQNNVRTNLSFAFAMDAVIDDRQFIDGLPNATFGQPVCRITRDGIPILDATGRPTSDPQGLAMLAADCKPLNIFGTSYADPAAAELQREALAYAFKDSLSDGANHLHVLSLTASGPLWEGWAGPLTGAFGFELREDEVDNQGTRGPFYLRADIARAWGDAFGGRTRVAEGYSELNLPLVADLPGIRLWSVNAGMRYALYNNRGGAGTTGQSASQDTLNWKFSTVFEPFDFVRARLTRSRDLRAAGYRDLFLSQPGVPDSVGGLQARNPWRDRTPDSQENQYERWGTVSVGNPDLKPERSDTLTLGLVLSPGGWAQGMRLAADYYRIRVRDGIYTPYTFANPVLACWENSGNVEPRYIDGDVDPAAPGINGLINDALPECREIIFAIEDGRRNLHDIVSHNATRPANGLPYQRRGVDLSWNYLFPLSDVFETLPGSLSLTARATRALESSGVQHTCSLNAVLQCVDSFTFVDQVGQMRSNVFIPGVLATPKWTGNIIGTYRMRRLTTSLSARYIGGARLDNTWSDRAGEPHYKNADGEFLYGSVDRNWVKPYFNFSLNASYDLQVANLRQFEVFGSVNNLFNKSPPFTGGGISGASAQYHDTMGRAYRVGVRMRF